MDVSIIWMDDAVDCIFRNFDVMGIQNFLNMHPGIDLSRLRDPYSGNSPMHTLVSKCFYCNDDQGSDLM